MSISVKCRQCGQKYALKEELAGKRFRCKKCEAPVRVPVPREAVEEDPWETDDFADYDDYEDDFRKPAPTPRVKKRPKAAPTKKKRSKRRSSSSSSTIGPLLAKIGGGLFGFLAVLGLILRIMNAGGVDFGGSWQSYTTPDGNITVQMPGTVKSVPVRDMLPGGQSYGAERRSFACIIVVEPMPAEMKGLSEEQMQEAMRLGSSFIGGRNAQVSQINGRPCITFEKGPTNGLHISGIAFVHKDKVYTLNYAYKGSKGSEERKFFDSVQFN